MLRAAHWKQWMWEQKMPQRTLHTWTPSVSKTEVSTTNKHRYMHSYFISLLIKIDVVIRIWMDELCEYLCAYVCSLISWHIYWGVKEAVFLHSFHLHLHFQHPPVFLLTTSTHFCHYIPILLPSHKYECVMCMWRYNNPWMYVSPDGAEAKFHTPIPLARIHGEGRGPVGGWFWIRLFLDSIQKRSLVFPHKQ